MTAADEGVKRQCNTMQHEPQSQRKVTNIANSTFKVAKSRAKHGRCRWTWVQQHWHCVWLGQRFWWLILLHSFICYETEANLVIKWATQLHTSAQLPTRAYCSRQCLGRGVRWRWSVRLEEGTGVCLLERLCLRWTTLIDEQKLSRRIK